MKSKQRRYIEKNPHHIWAYRRDGSKFVAHFKNKREATAWAKVTNTPLGKSTSASKNQPIKKSHQPTLFGMTPQGFGNQSFGFKFPKPRSKSRSKNPFNFGF